MIEWSYPWAFSLLVLPFVVYKLAKPASHNQVPIKIPFYHSMVKHCSTDAINIKSNATSLLKLILMYLVFTGLVAALAKPYQLQKPIEQIQPSRDILIALDLSGSMETEDYEKDGQLITRFEAAKEAIVNFVATRQGERMGLVVFGNAPFIQLPLTTDVKLFNQMLLELAPRLAGAKTAIGDAIGLSINVLEKSEMENKLVILVTDGNDTSSKMLPLQAAGIAKTEDLVIYTIGIGNKSGQGEEQFDEKTMQEVASITGGQYGYAKDFKQLETLYDNINQLEQVDIKKIQFQPQLELFYMPLLLSAVMMLLYMLIVLIELMVLAKQKPSSHSVKVISKDEVAYD